MTALCTYKSVNSPLSLHVPYSGGTEYQRCATVVNSGGEGK